MALFANVMGSWGRWTCKHTWVRARWADGSYGFRCGHCMAAYPHTWNQLLTQALPSQPLTPPLPHLTALADKAALQG